MNCLLLFLSPMKFSFYAEMGNNRISTADSAYEVSGWVCMPHVLSTGTFYTIVHSFLHCSRQMSVFCCADVFTNLS